MIIFTYISFITIHISHLITFVYTYRNKLSKVFRKRSSHAVRFNMITKSFYTQAFQINHHTCKTSHLSHLCFDLNIYWIIKSILLPLCAWYKAVNINKLFVLFAFAVGSFSSRCLDAYPHYITCSTQRLEKTSFIVRTRMRIANYFFSMQMAYCKPKDLPIYSLPTT